MSMRRKREDPYAILGVARTASTEEIKAAFKVRAKALHPDMNRHHDTTAEFQRLQAAFAVLEDPKQRELHDLGNLPPTTEGPRSAAADSGAPFRSGRRRRRARLFVGLVGALLLGGFVFFLAQWESDDLPPPLPRTQSSAISALPGLDQQMQAAVYQGAQNYSGAQQSAMSEVEMAGRDGRKFVLSNAAAKQLEPARNKLVSDSEELRERAASLKARRDGLERTRRTLDPSQLTAIKAFNETVETLNRDSTEFERDVEAHKKEIEAFFGELERVALRAL